MGERSPPPAVRDEGGRSSNEQRLMASASEAGSLLRIVTVGSSPTVTTTHPVGVQDQRLPFFCVPRQNTQFLKSAYLGGRSVHNHHRALARLTSEIIVYVSPKNWNSSDDCKHHHFMKFAPERIIMQQAFPEISILFQYAN